MAAALEVFRNGAWHELTSLKVYRSGAWRQLKTLKVYSGGAWRLIGSFIQALTVSAPSGVAGTWFNTTGHPQTYGTDPATATPSGGLGPYTYSWAQISGDAMTATAPNSATTAFNKAMLSGTAQAVFRVTVTDSTGQTAAADVTAVIVVMT